jgi:hypothetical protein
MMERALNSKKPDYLHYMWSVRMELLRRRIHEEDYLHAAIQRLAHVLSNELMDITMEGGRHERQRKKRK